MLVAMKLRCHQLALAETVLFWRSRACVTLLHRRDVFAAPPTWPA